MAVRLSLDTSFLIDLHRERRKGDDTGAAHRFLRGAPDAELFLASVALGEFAEGFASPEDPLVRTVRAQHTVLPVDEETGLIYSGVARGLRSLGLLIGANDLWIGCTSLRFGLPLVTANVEEFGRIEGLDVIDHRAH